MDAHDRDTLCTNSKSLKLRYLETLKKEKTLKEMGYVVHTMWSCDFDREKVVNPPLQKYICELNIPQTIHIRDSYFGG